MRLAFWALLFAWSSFAQTQTTISDTLRTATAAPFTGKIKIDAPAMTLPDGTTVTLYPDDTTSPTGTSYRVLYNPCSGPAWSEAWVVPTSAAPLKISALRATPAPTVLVAPRWSDQETPPGQVDGFNRVFTLGRAPSPASSLILVRNGIVQKRGLDYLLTTPGMAWSICR